MSSSSTQKKRTGAEEDSASLKKLKQDSPDSVNEDLDYLKKSIKEEVINELAPQITRLEDDLKAVKRLLEAFASNSGNTEKSTLNLLKKYDGDPVNDGRPAQSEDAKDHNLPVQEKEFSKNFEDTKAERDSQSSNKPSFGKSSFPLISPNISEKNDLQSKPSHEKVGRSEDEHVFGVPFSAKGITTKNGIFSSLTSKEPKGIPAEGEEKEKDNDSNSNNRTTTAASSFGGSIFGANSQFSNAFQNVLKRKSFLDDDNKDSSLHKSRDNIDLAKERSNTPPEQYKQVNLTPVEKIETGEEDEQSHFNATVKAFELNLSNVSEGWKERGLGPIRVNQSLSDPGNSRIIMRSQGLLRVILNLKITKSTELLKNLESSLSPGKFLRLNSISQQQQPIQYLIKFSSQQLRDEFYDQVESMKTFLK